ncbi:MAG: SUMF1/EgtB/PvdO family nonheme iron enzyme [Planctomycetota bacterium]|nr:SUMF1/EgtB/PvdO family nonheme iron enzyme [Planctomycetota bacterium]
MILHLLLTPVLLVPALAQNANVAPAPGLVELSGGRTTIGSSVKEIEILVKDQSEAKTLVRALDGETPQHTNTVAPFHIGRTEITNEQYAAFVRATGYRPPIDWAKAPVEEGRQAYFEMIREKRERGESTDQKFDPSKWWAENWEGKAWAIPEGDEMRPVVHVDYRDAMAYCRWSGLRLPTEFEFQHSVRGKGKDPYPWGDAWEDEKFAATSEYRRISRTFPVGTFPAGASNEGVLDLAGNVWEWTDSAYLAYPDFEKNEYKVPGQRQKVSAPVHKWDGNQRVVVGGSFQSSKMAARCTVRRGSDQTQMTNALGFRVAATPKPARDYVQHVWNQDLRNSDARPSGVSYDLESVLGQDLWTSTKGGGKSPEGYAVITDYDVVAFVPLAEMEETEDAAYRKATLNEPQHLGFLTMTEASIEPALAPGTYLVAFRAQGDTRYDDEVAPPEEVKQEGDDEGKKDDEPKSRKREDPWAKVLDITVDNILFLDANTGEMLAAQPVLGVIFGNTENKAGFEPMNKTLLVDDPAKPGKQIEHVERWLMIRAEVRTRLRRRVLPFSLELKMEPEYWEKPWR